MVPGTSVKSSKEALRLSRIYPGTIYSTAGTPLICYYNFGSIRVYSSHTFFQASIRTTQSRLSRTRPAGSNSRRSPSRSNAWPLVRAASTISETSPSPRCRRRFSKNKYDSPRRWTSRYSFTNDLRKPMCWKYLTSMAIENRSMHLWLIAFCLVAAFRMSRRSWFVDLWAPRMRRESTSREVSISVLPDICARWIFSNRLVCTWFITWNAF